MTTTPKEATRTAFEEALRVKEEELGRKLSPVEFKQLKERLEAKAVGRNPNDPRLGNLAGSKLATSQKRKDNGKTYNRRTLGDSDATVLHFLAKVEVATSRQVAAVLVKKDSTGKPLGGAVAQSTAHRRLLGLEEMGLVGSFHDWGTSKLWFVRKRGLYVADSFDRLDAVDYKAVTTERVEAWGDKLGHKLAVGEVVATLLSGRFGEVYGIKVPEPFTVFVDMEIERFRGDLKVHKRTPDAVVVREDGGKLAIEVELHRKAGRIYQEIFDSYKWGRTQSLWLVQKDGVKAAIDKGAASEAIGAFTVEPFKKVDGSVFIDRAWRL